MTIVVGVVGPRGRILVGADSASTEDDDFSQLSSAEEKVFRSGEFIIGGAGSWRGLQLARYAFEPSKRPFRTPIDKWMVTTFIDDLRDVWKKGGHLWKSKADDDPVEERVGTSLIVGYRGTLWVVEEDLQIIRMRDEYAAIGSGATPALGALYATQKDGATKARVLVALRAAERYNAACRSPFVVIDNNGSED